jgi:putative nucleotidyltransferase with HDIG domain
MKRILFVDDEPKLLDGLQRMLRGQRRVWDMQFALGAKAALEVLETTPIDVVVTDMRMPGMDGAELLKCVHERYPGVMRVILSGQFDAGVGMRAVPVAHQFLVKPCDPEKLKAVIDRSSSLGSSLSDEDTRRVVSAVDSLPSPSRTCMRLLEEIENPQSSLDSIGQIIGSDVALAAKVLHLANSAFFSLSHEISDVKSALGCLGFDVLKELVMSAEILRTFHPVRPIPGFCIEALEAHSFLSARIARYLAQQSGRPSSVADLAALLHDTGKLILATRLPDLYERCCAVQTQRGSPPQEVELEIFGTTHAEVGAHLLNLWGFPAEAVDAIQAHHRPYGAAAGAFNVRAIVYLSNLLAHECGPNEEELPIPNYADAEYLTALGAIDRFPEWRVAARQIAKSR